MTAGEAPGGEAGQVLARRSRWAGVQVPGPAGERCGGNLVREAREEPSSPLLWRQRACLRKVTGRSHPGSAPRVSPDASAAREGPRWRNQARRCWGNDGAGVWRARQYVNGPKYDADRVGAGCGRGSGVEAAAAVPGSAVMGGRSGRTQSRRARSSAGGRRYAARVPEPRQSLQWQQSQAKVKQNLPGTHVNCAGQPSV